MTLTISLIQVILWAISPKINHQNIPNKIQTLIKRIHDFPLLNILRFLAKLLPPSLRQEIVIVICILGSLFWLGRFQGQADAYRDAVNNTSTRPIVSIVSAKDKLPLGRNLDNLFTNPSLKESRIFGDVEQFKQTFKGINDDTDQSTVWRLLIESNDWVYVFPSMPYDAQFNQRPPVLAINRGDGGVQLLIISRPNLR
jgi:hypothetical protein